MGETRFNPTERRITAMKGKMGNTVPGMSGKSTCQSAMNSGGPKGSSNKPSQGNKAFKGKKK